MRTVVRQWTGIPTCVGIAPTKTLAKLANAVAKKNPTFGQVCDLMHPAVRDAVLRAFEVSDVWGIGQATTAKLAALPSVLHQGRARSAVMPEAGQIASKM